MRQTNIEEKKYSKHKKSPRFLEDFAVRTGLISIGIKLEPELWDDKEQVVKKKHPNSARMNAFIAQKVADAKEVALKLETTKGYVTSKGIKANILGRPAISFTQYFSDYLKILKNKGKIGTHDKANATYLKFKKYTNEKEIMFDEIDVNFLRNYEDYLKTTLKNKNNTIHSNLKVFRKLFNDAIREDIIELKLNPFTKFKLSWENTNKEYLTDEELLIVEEYSIKEGTMKYHHRNAYIFASYAAGIRISDLLQLRWKDFDGTHIQFKTQKTDDTIRVKLPTKALNIITYYKNLHEKTNLNHYIFPFLDNDKDYSNPEIHFRAISSSTAYMNKDLKEIKLALELNKKLNFHTSRHTWATSALRKGMRIEYVSKLMTHSNIKTTQIYAKIVNSELDKAMDVFG
jgi:integrase/recombinase XerD